VPALIYRLYFILVRQYLKIILCLLDCRRYLYYSRVVAMLLLVVLACNHTAALITIHHPYFLSYRKSNSPTTTNRKFAICKKLSTTHAKLYFACFSLAVYSIYLRFLDGNYASLAPTVKLWELTVPNTFRAPVSPTTSSEVQSSGRLH
jgi:hypothetical protein